jgi:hypothetical protein
VKRVPAGLLTKIDSPSGSPSSMRCSSVDPTPVPGVKPGRFATSDFEVIHQAGNAEELARVLGAHLEGEPVGTQRRTASLRWGDRCWPKESSSCDRSPSIGLAEPDGPATLETDAAARVLLVWGRRPADPSRICSRVGPETLGRLRQLLSGY